MPARLGRVPLVTLVVLGTGCLESRPGHWLGPGATTTASHDAAADAHAGDAQADDADTADAKPKTWPRPCAHLYDQDTLPEFHLDFPAGGWDAIVADCAAGLKQYRPVQFSYDGKSVQAMVRLKGGWSWTCDKMQFVISFNETDVEARFHGLRKISLDAAWYDHTLMHERLAFPLFAARGLPYSCVNHARLFVNGEYYGLYSNTERVDKEYLDRNFEQSNGNLYYALNELKTNEDVPDEGNKAGERLNNLKNATTVAEVAGVADLDELLSEWAVEAMIPATDNYWAGVQINFYAYDHPTRGFLWIPYDLDAVFGDTLYQDGSLVFPDALTADPILWEHTWWGKELLVRMVLSDRDACERFVEALRRAREVYDPDAMAAQVDEWDAQITKALADDPHKTYTMEQHADAIAKLKIFLAQRAAYIDLWLEGGDHCPAVFPPYVVPPSRGGPGG